MNTSSPLPRTLSILVLAALVAAGCASARHSDGVPHDALPPAAYASTDAATVKMSVGSSCWSGGCVDTVPAAERSDVAKLVLNGTDEVTVKLPFTPKSVEVSIDGAVAQKQQAQRSLTLPARPALVEVHAVGAKGDATYVIQLIDVSQASI